MPDDVVNRVAPDAVRKGCLVHAFFGQKGLASASSVGNTV